MLLEFLKFCHREKLTMPCQRFTGNLLINHAYSWEQHWKICLHYIDTRELVNQPSSRYDTIFLEKIDFKLLFSCKIPGDQGTRKYCFVGHWWLDGCAVALLSYGPTSQWNVRVAFFCASSWQTINLIFFHSCFDRFVVEINDLAF